MTARALMAETESMVEALIREHVEVLASPTECDHDRLILAKGTIVGLRMAMDAQEAAYKKIGE